MSGAEVLHVLQDQWRFAHKIDANVQYELPLRRDIPVETAANELGLGAWIDDWATIALMFRRLFRVESISKNRWRTILEPPREKTLGPVCDFISDHALAPLIEPEPTANGRAWADGALNSIRAVLRDANIEIRGIHSKRKLAPFIRKHYRVFTLIVSRLAPGRMPAIRSTGPWRIPARFGAMASAAAFVSASVDRYPWQEMESLHWLGVGGMVTGGLLGWTNQFVKYRIGELHTFGDLAWTLTSPPPKGEPVVSTENEPIYWGASHHPQFDWIPMGASGYGNI